MPAPARKITIRTASGFEATIPASEGPTLADVLKGSATLSADPERKLRWIEGLAALSGIKVKRTGKGVKLVSPLTGEEYPLAFGVAADLADRSSTASDENRGQRVNAEPLQMSSLPRQLTI